jgi:hypothetical protein
MTSRNIDATALSNLTSKHVTNFPLVEMQLATGTLYIAGLPHSIDWNGHTWLADKGLGSIEPIVESTGEVVGCTFTLSGVPSSIISQVLTENVRGRLVIVRVATLNGTTVSVDANVWQGGLDTMTIVDGEDTATVQVTAEHKLISWQTPHPVNFSHQEQLLVDATDTFYSRMAELATKPIIWPNKEFFKR